MTFQPGIGIIGVGKLGFHIAKRLIQGYQYVYVYDVLEERRKACLTEGAFPVSSPSALVPKCDFILLALPDPETVTKTIKKLNLSKTNKKRIYILDLSTNSPDSVVKLRDFCKARGCIFLDSPLTGGMIGAKNGTMTAMVGGEADDVNKIIPVLKLFSSKMIHVGPSGCGAATKLIHNMLGEIQVYAIAEALCLAKRLGLNVNKVFEVLANGMAGSRILTELYANGALSRNFEPQATVKTAEKDQRLLLELADKEGITLTFTPIVYSQIQELLRRGLGNNDVTSAILLYEEKLGATVSVEPHFNDKNSFSS